MAYKIHDLFEEPLQDQLLWRYLDLSKYINMLVTNGLWFSRSDLLGDSFEGSTTLKSKIQSEEFFYSLLSDGKNLEKVNKVIAHMSKVINFNRTHMFINSWHMSDHESEAMWRIYGTDFGIAVISSLDRIKSNIHWYENFYAGRVKYTNYETDIIDWGNAFSPFLHKRRSFEYEKEFRIVIEHEREKISDYAAEGAMLTFEEFQRITPTGILTPANIDELISVVHVSPSSPDWYFETVKEVTKTLGFSFDVKRSSLSIDPIF